MFQWYGVANLEDKFWNRLIRLFSNETKESSARAHSYSHRVKFHQNRFPPNHFADKNKVSGYLHGAKNIQFFGSITQTHICAFSSRGRRFFVSSLERWKQKETHPSIHSVCMRVMCQISTRTLFAKYSLATFTRCPVAGPAEEDMEREKTLNFIYIWDELVNGDLKNNSLFARSLTLILLWRNIYLYNSAERSIGVFPILAVWGGCTPLLKLEFF
jgi:hypothetical protein